MPKLEVDLFYDAFFTALVVASYSEDE